MIAMVMIFIMSILGISAMRGATMEGRLASNSLQKEITFQSAESATDTVLAKQDSLTNIICQPTQEASSPDSNQIDGQETKTTLEDGGQTLPVGFEIGGPISARRFVVTGFSDLPGAHTSTTIAQGVVIVGANDPSGGC